MKPIRDVRGGKGHQPAHDDTGYGVRTLCGLAFDYGYYVEAKKVTCKTCLKLKRGGE